MLQKRTDFGSKLTKLSKNIFAKNGATIGPRTVLQGYFLQTMYKKTWKNRVLKTKADLLLGESSDSRSKLHIDYLEGEASRIFNNHYGKRFKLTGDYTTHNTLKSIYEKLELQNDFTLQTQQLNEMTVKSQSAQRELNRYSEFIRNYELSAKIIGDPVEMQRKINNGTKHIMEDIEALSVIVDDLDDGLQLQPPTNEDIRG